MDPKRMLLLLLARRYRGPEDGEGTGDDKVVDRGDDFTPDESDDEAAELAAAAALLAKSKKEKPLPKTVKAAKAELDGTDPEDEEDPPEDETEEQKAEREAAAAKAGKKKGVIPVDRHEKILAKERERREALETQVKNFQGAQTVVKTNEAITQRETKIVELEAELAKAQTDGEHAKVAKLMGDIRKLDREIVQLDAEVKIAAAEARAIETTRYSVTLERIEQAYPALNEDHEDFDKDVYEDVLDLMDAYRKQGRTPSEALQRAVKMKFGAATAKQQAAVTVKPKVDEEDIQATTKADRAKAANDKALAAKAKSPATAVAKAGMNNTDAGATKTAKDVIKMSQSDFAKLDEKELARLRGDILETEE